MSVKMTAGELVEFFNDKNEWGINDDMWVEDLFVTNLKDEPFGPDFDPADLCESDVIKVVSGFMCSEVDVFPICKRIRRWLDNRENVIISVSVSKDTADEILTLLGSSGIKHKVLKKN